MPTPISLIVDDSCPLVHVFAHHWRDVHRKELVTPDGRPMPMWIPNDFLRRFCDVVERHGMAGKFSIVPAPALLGDVVRGIEGHDRELTREWLDIVRNRLSARWDFCSEGITHNLALDLETGRLLEQGENEWSQHQSRKTLHAYLVRQLELLRDAGIDATGVTSPWVFGTRVERDYIASIVAAQKAVYGRRFSWYFLHMLWEEPDARPWIAYAREDTTLVHIPALVPDYWWPTIDSPRTDPEFINALVDRFLTSDGRGGKIREVLDAGGWPVILTHWQSLFSNGLESGLAVLDALGTRVSECLGDEVRWSSFTEMARRTVERVGEAVAPEI